MKKSNKQEQSKIIFRNELTSDQKLEIKEAFDMIDIDKSGKLDINELKAALKALGLDNKNNDTNTIIELMDKNKDGLISFDEFIEIITIQITDKDHESQFIKIHEILSDDNSSKINVKSLAYICEELGEKISDDELKEMIEEADLDKDGEVDVNEFLSLMKKINVLA
jgi:centrin-1